MLDRLHGRTRGKRGNLHRLGRRVGIGIEHHRASRRCLNLAHVLRAMHPLELIACDRARRGRGAAAHGPAVRHRVEHVARSMRSGWPGGVTCSSNRGEVMSSIVGFRLSVFGSSFWRIRVENSRFVSAFGIRLACL